MDFSCRSVTLVALIRTFSEDKPLVSGLSSPALSVCEEALEPMMVTYSRGPSTCWEDSLASHISIETWSRCFYDVGDQELDDLGTPGKA